MAKLQAKWAIENGGKPPLSAEGRERISRAQKRRWEIYRMPYWQRELGGDIWGLGDGDLLELLDLWGSGDGDLLEPLPGFETI
jgi:hypothetical protein